MQHQLFSQYHLFSASHRTGNQPARKAWPIDLLVLGTRSLAPVPSHPRLLRDIGLLDELPPHEEPEAREAAMQMLRNI